MQNGVALGAFVRGVHFWAAQAMYVLAALHLLRVFLTGSYKKPREANWLIGVAMFALVIGAMFTGTVLKWDQEGFEALSHNLEISKVLGGVGTFFGAGFASNVPVLVRLYGAHVAMIPGLILALMIAHFLLVKRHRISPDPDNPRAVGERTGPFTLHLRRVAIFGLVLIGVLGLLSVLFPPGIGPSPVAGVEVTKPPWVFWWMFGLENYLGVKGILYGVIAFFGALVALPFIDRRGERRWRKRRVAMVGLVVVVGLMAWLSYVTATSGMTNHLG
jgi:ubiquinol-cytochrome c reductase cytochrome b subunit